GARAPAGGPDWGVAPVAGAAPAPPVREDREAAAPRLRALDGRRQHRLQNGILSKIGADEVAITASEALGVVRNVDVARMQRGLDPHAHGAASQLLARGIEEDVGDRVDVR